MSKIIDNICRARDILQIRDISELNKKLKFQRGLFQAIFDECHRHLCRKTKDYSYKLDFTSQDLRELAQDIRNVLKRWESEMNPEKNIKSLKKQVVNGKLDFGSYTEAKLPILAARKDNVQVLYELLNLLEFHSVFLYYLEIASNDEFAITCTERL